MAPTARTAGGSATYTEEAIKILNEKFVCFAPGWGINSNDEVYSETWKRFYLGKSRPDEGKGWLTGTQLVLMTSSGRLPSFPAPPRGLESAPQSS